MSLGPALALFRKEVETARAYDDGRLEIRFTDGAELVVASTEDFEAWEFAGGSLKVVCAPGGALSVWR